MNKDDRIHQQNIFDSTGLLPKRNWRTALWHVTLLVVVVFLTEISGAQADMVFDFQMKLAQKGNAEAQFKVGEMYETGRGVEKNMVEAKRWITRAAAQGNEAANWKLLYYDLQNNGVTAANKPKLAELQQAAKGGNGVAQYYVGLMHSRGVGLRRNSTVALDWLGKASTLGVTAAEAEIAHINEARRQYQLRAKQDEERKAREQEEAKRQEEERRKVAAQREAEKRKQQQEASKKKAKQNEQAARQREAERIAAEERAKQERLIAQREAEAEQKRQAVLEQRKKKEEKKKAQFESDPCAGKSARFLSTCR
jgi:flagellar biosynthesis GTPase FlhF